VTSPTGPPPPGLVGPLALIAAISAGAGLLGATWVAARLAAGAGHPVPAVGAPLLHAVLEQGLPALIGPEGSPVMFWVIFALLLTITLGVLAGVGFGASRVLGYTPGRPGTAMASRRELGDLTGRAAVARARQLRPSLDKHHHLTGGDLGLRLGRLRGGHDVLASHEDVVLEICGPRSNKTSALVVPAVLGAPGPVITTSNKVDAYTLTVHGRTHAGRVFVLDPQGIARVEQDWWWNPLAAVTDMATAAQLATHFIATVGGGSDRADPYFTPASSRLLAQHLLAAAAATPARSLRDVRGWLATRDEAPADLLDDAGLGEVATSLRATMEAPPEQRGGLYETALTALGPLEIETVARYVTPPHTWSGGAPRAKTITEFDPWQFYAGYTPSPSPDGRPRDTLYLLTKEGAGTAAPVVAALVDRLLKTAAEIAAARGGRCEPPPRIVLDEAANICPITDLPDLYSYFGSMSLQVVTILQSYQQGVAVWGQSGMHKLWSAATIKLIGAGVHDAEFCEQVSRLIGDHDIAHDTTQSGRGGGSVSHTTRRERIMTAADIAALPKTQAILIASGRRPALLELLPWYTEPDADTLAAHAATATNQVRQAAAAALGPDNPIGQALHRELTHQQTP
jgi:type IV secretion system protein VirD4